MRKNLAEFCRRGLVACGLGPIVLTIIYMILYSRGLVESVRVPELCTGIISLTALAFVAGGTNVVYQTERLPLVGESPHPCVHRYIRHRLSSHLGGHLCRDAQKDREAEQNIAGDTAEYVKLLKKAARFLAGQLLLSYFSPRSGP